MRGAVPAREISAGEGRDDRTVLKQEGLNQGRQNAVGVGPGLGTIVKRTVAKNHVRPNGALGVVVVGGNAGDVQKRKDLVFVLQEPCRETLPILVGVDSGGKVEESRRVCLAP